MEEILIPEYRRNRILELLRQRESLSVKALSDLIGVSQATIRRDLTELNRQGEIKRSHGGAVLALSHGTTFEPTFEMASRDARQEKEMIAAVAAETLQDGQSVILDSGTTLVRLAELIQKKKRHLTVVTNDLLVAGLLSNSPDIRLIIPGGTLRPGSYTLLGEPGLSFIRGLHVDTAYMGIQAIKDDCLSDTSTDVCIMKRQMAAAAARTIVLADSSKFGKTAFRDAFEIGDVDQIITNRNLPESMVDYYRGKGVKVVLA